MPEITISIGTILWIAGAIITIAGAYKILSPVLKLSGRVTNLENKQEKSFEKLDKMEQSVNNLREESKIADRLLVRAMIGITDNRITNNNIEGLKEIKKDLMEFLQQN